MTGRTLIVVVAEADSNHLTFGSFKSNLLDKLDADLALCGSESSMDPVSEFKGIAKYIWNFEQPAAWATAFDEFAQGKEWRALLEFRGQWLGAIDRSDADANGDPSAYFLTREFVRRMILDTEILRTYEWIIITRSDFIWPISHPPMKFFSKDKIYFPDGLRNGGYPQRHVMIPVHLFERYMESFKSIFSTPVALATRMRRYGNDEWNVEAFLKFQLSEQCLRKHVRFFPYLMYSIRTSDRGNRQRLDAYDYGCGHFFDQDIEYDSCRILEAIISEENTWKMMLGIKRFLHPRFYLYALLRVLAESRSHNSLPPLHSPVWRFVLYVLQPN